MIVLGQLTMAQLENLAADPAPPQATGRVYFNTTSGKFRGFDGTSWADLGSAGGGGALSVVGSRGVPTLIASGTSIIPTSAQRQLIFVAGSGGASTLGGIAQIAAGITVGQEIIVEGRNGINTVTMLDGTGLDLNGPCTLGAGSTIGLVWDGTNWVEMWRR